MPVALLTNDRALSILHEAVSKGCYVEHDKSAGTAKAFHSGDLVFQALQMGKRGPWICRFLNTESITWTETTSS
jgi:hypothetical protein